MFKVLAVYVSLFYLIFKRVLFFLGNIFISVFFEAFLRYFLVVFFILVGWGFFLVDKIMI